MGLLTFSLNITLDGCIDHQEGIADDETHAYFTELMNESGAMLWGRTTYEMMESYWPAVARGEIGAPAALVEWAQALEVKPKYVVSSRRNDFPWTNSHHLSGDLAEAVTALKIDLCGTVEQRCGRDALSPQLTAQGRDSVATQKAASFHSPPFSCSRARRGT